MMEGKEESEGGFHRVLTALDLFFIGVGSIIGSGIFVMSGQAAALYAGPAVVLSFMLSGACCVIYATCFAELASMIPTSGSAYTYSKAAFGRFMGWVVGWSLVSEYMFGVAVISVGWSGYFESMLRNLGMPFPAYVASSPLSVKDDVIEWTGSYVNLPAVLLVTLCTTIVVVGVRESTTLTSIFVSIKIAAITVFVICGAFYVNAENWEPFMPENTGMFGQFGWSGVLRASSVIFFAYIGFDAVTTGASECQDPQRDLPIAIFSSLGLVTVLYCSTALVLTGMISYTQLMVPDPLAVGIDAHPALSSWLSPILKLAVICGLPSGVIVGIYSQSRIFYVMASDGLLPSLFKELHGTFRTPYIGAVLAGSLPVNVVGELCSIGTLLAFGTVCAGVIKLRELQPDAPRPFRVPFFPYVPYLGVVLAILQTCVLPLTTWLRMAAWMLLGLLIYFTYGAFHKVPDKEERDSDYDYDRYERVH